MQTPEADSDVKSMTTETKMALEYEALGIIESALHELPDEQKQQVGRRLWKAIRDRDWQKEGFLPLSDLAFRLDPPVGGS